MDIKKVKRVNPSDLEIGVLVERRDHPQLTKRQAGVIARQELAKNPHAYKVGGSKERVVVILNQNVKAIPPRKRKRAPAMRQEQQQVVDDKPGWIPETFRRPFG